MPWSAECLGLLSALVYVNEIPSRRDGIPASQSHLPFAFHGSNDQLLIRVTQYSKLASPPNYAVISKAFPSSKFKVRDGQLNLYGMRFLANANLITSARKLLLPERLIFLSTLINFWT